MLPLRIFYLFFYHKFTGGPHIFEKSNFIFLSRLRNNMYFATFTAKTSLVRCLRWRKTSVKHQSWIYGPSDSNFYDIREVIRDFFPCKSSIDWCNIIWFRSLTHFLALARGESCVFLPSMVFSCPPRSQHFIHKTRHALCLDDQSANFIPECSVIHAVMAGTFSFSSLRHTQKK